MADEPEDQNPVDQLVDLFVYAPVGLLYEYQDVVPKLVKRGKSQVQLAKVIGQMARKRGRADSFTVLAEGVAGMVAKQVTEIGSAIGLAPPGTAAENTQPPPPSPAAAKSVGKAKNAPQVSAGGAVTKKAATKGAAKPLPIARYDELTAKEIIGLLDDLEPTQLGRIRDHEQANRARKTILGKLDRLAS